MSRWKSPEFCLYYVIAAWVYFELSRVTVEMSSSASNAEFHRFSGRLSPGWLFGRRVDNSDGQYANFRNKIPMLFGLLAVHVGVGRWFAVRKVAGRWLAFNLSFSLLVLGVLHGVGGVVKIVSILSCNYVLVNALKPSRVKVGACWAFGIGILFLNDWYRGYQFSIICPPLSFLDSYSGLVPRWYVTFNFSVLRMISFAMDYNYALHPELQKKVIELERSKVDRYSDKGRILYSHSLSDYSYVNYLAYCLYFPLYLAGPIVTFNSFLSQVQSPPKIDSWDTIKYGIRLLASILLMEVMLHWFYVVAISKSAAWDNLRPLQLIAFSYWNLKLIWLKLFIIWRFFRLWSLSDGMLVEENMPRCMSNNYSPIDFWKTWHRSYNRWLVRYMYVPLGGAKYKMYNIFPVFTFVALWHDIELRLLIWGWLIALFILPELILSTVAKRMFSKYPFYRFICGFGASINISAMIMGNLIGFCSGATDVLVKLFHPDNAGLIVTVLILLTLAAQMMFEVREDEEKARSLKRSRDFNQHQLVN